MRKKPSGRITINSKDVKAGDVFIAIKGEKADGHAYVDEAIRRGAGLCVVSKAPRKNVSEKDKSRIMVVSDTRHALSRMAAEFYGRPSEKLKVIGVTGTNGKTTVAFLLDKILNDMKFKTGMVGTIVYKIGARTFTADRTTPDALELNRLLSGMVREKIDYVVMEVSSHALHQKRTGHIFYDAAVFTNLTAEHLDYHKNMEDYFESKAMIFDNLKKSGVAVLNKDDARYPLFRKRISKRTVTYSVNADADIAPLDVEATLDGSKFDIKTPKGILKIRTRLIGRHNISNILAAAATAYALGFNRKKTERSINAFSELPGRLERIDSGRGFKVFIDYAHTHDALKNVLAALKPYVKGRLITVFGCGGDRDKSKRPLMGEISGKLSDYTVITSDNPRNEDPEVIAKEIENGIKHISANYSIILSRKQAIKKALEIARAGDIVLIAGKGHEADQIIGDKRIKFNDKETAKTFLRNAKK